MKKLTLSLALAALLANLLIPQQYHRYNACCGSSIMVALTGAHSMCADHGKTDCCKPTIIKLRDTGTNETLTVAAAQHAPDVAVFVPVAQFVSELVCDQIADAGLAYSVDPPPALDVLTRHSRLNI